jgi:hypothetical protein
VFLPWLSALTVGPKLDPKSALNIGVAAHIAAAASRGRRYDPAMTAEERSDISNGIWLCQNHAKLIDSDPDLYTRKVLIGFKERAESETKLQVGKSQDDNGAEAPGQELTESCARSSLN